MIKKHYPKANVHGNQIPGNTGCFEIFVNDELIHSKRGGEGHARDYNKLLVQIKESLK